MSLINRAEKANEKLKKYLPQCWYGICASEFTGISDFNSAIGKVHLLLNTATGVAALVAVGLLIYGGYNFILAAGDADKIDKGQRIIVNTIIGLVIVFIARLIIQFVVDRVM